MADLSSEDTLRLNVLLAHEFQAIRIDEASMTVYGLSERGEAKVPLNPNCRDDLYLRRVREVLSGHVLGSPGGYPIYLRRWTRMGQARNESLEQLLKLGEPEAVVAVVHAPGLTEELARRAWWAMPNSENARRMLENEAVATGKMGKVLTEYLLEYLPFEDDPKAMMETVRLILGAGRLSEDERQQIWRKGLQKTAYLMGFLAACPNDLPSDVPARQDWEVHSGRLLSLIREGNSLAALLVNIFSARGQAFLEAAGKVLDKASNQDVVIALFGLLAKYFAPALPGGDPDATLDTVIAEAEVLCTVDPDTKRETLPELSQVLEVAPDLRLELRAMVVLSRLGYPVLRPILSQTTAIGALMRKKLQPITMPIRAQFAILRGTSSK